MYKRQGKYLPGVIAAKPVNFMSASEKASAGAADISSLSIDIGAVSAKDAAENFKIRIGEPVVPDVTLEYDEEHDLMFGKAFDCRIGCAALIETLRRLRDEKLDVDVVGVLSSQEEVGERGKMCIRDRMYDALYGRQSIEKKDSISVESQLE